MNASTQDDVVDVNYEIEATLRQIGGKWKPLILHLLITDGPKRFNEIEGHILLTSKRHLTNQLRELEADGLVERIVEAARPVRVTYAVTAKGRTLEDILEAMCAWGLRHAAPRYRILHGECAGDASD